MEVGEQHVDDLELGTRGVMKRSVRPSDVPVAAADFEGADHRGADRDDALGALRTPSSVGVGDDVGLAVHRVVLDTRLGHGTEGVESDRELDRRDADAPIAATRRAGPA